MKAAKESVKMLCILGIAQQAVCLQNKNNEAKPLEKLFGPNEGKAIKCQLQKIITKKKSKRKSRSRNKSSSKGISKTGGGNTKGKLLSKLIQNCTQKHSQKLHKLINDNPPLEKGLENMVVSLKKLDYAKLVAQKGGGLLEGRVSMMEFGAFTFAFSTILYVYWRQIKKFFYWVQKFIFGFTLPFTKISIIRVLSWILLMGFGVYFERWEFVGVAIMFTSLELGKGTVDHILDKENEFDDDDYTSEN